MQKIIYSKIILFLGTATVFLSSYFQFDNEKVYIDSEYILSLDPCQSILSHLNSFNPNSFLPEPYLWYTTYINPGTLSMCLFNINWSMAIPIVLATIFIFSFLFIEGRIKNSIMTMSLSLFAIFNAYVFTTVHSTLSVFLFSYLAIFMSLYFFSKEEGIFTYLGLAISGLLLSPINPPISIISIMSICVGLYISCVEISLKNYLIKKIKSIIIFGLFFTLTCIPMVIHFSALSKKTVEEFRQEDYRITNQRSSYLNVFSGNSLWSLGYSYKGKPAFAFQDTLNSLSAVSINIVILCVYLTVILLFKNKKNTLSLVIFIITVPFIVGVKEGFFSDAYKTLVDGSAFFTIFRNGYKLMPLLYILFLSTLIYNFDRLNYKQRVAISIIFLSSSALFFSLLVIDKSLVSKDRELLIPKEYISKPKALPRGSSILILPPQYHTVFKWGITGADPESLWGVRIISRKPSLVPTDNNNFYDSLKNIIFTNQDLKKLKDLPLDYVLYRKKYDLDYYPQFKDYSFEEFKKTDLYKNCNLAEDNQEFIICKI